MKQPRRRIRHELKCWPEFFQPVWDGRKKFDYRRNDRNYQVADELLLREWDPEITGEVVTPLTGVPYQRVKGYTGREVLVRVDYIMSVADTSVLGLPFHPDYVIMGHSLVV